MALLLAPEFLPIFIFRLQPGDLKDISKAAESSEEGLTHGRESVMQEANWSARWKIAMDPRIKALKSTTFRGRRLTRRRIAQIQETVQLLPKNSRRELARTICEHFGWRTPNGGYSEQSALRVLEDLEALGILELPPKLKRGGPRRRAVHTPRSDPGPEVRCDLRELEPLSLERAFEKEAAEEWTELVDRHHYLGYASPIGQYMRYFVVDATGRRLVPPGWTGTIWRGPATVWRRLRAGARGSGAFASTTNGGSASSGPREVSARPKWKSWTTINSRRQVMRDPIHPGETLREDLNALGMSSAELARRIEVPVNRITEILNGRRSITGDTALRLGRFFGTSGEFWLNLQKLYELRLAERKSGPAIARLPTLDADSGLHATR